MIESNYVYRFKITAIAPTYKDGYVKAISNIPEVGGSGKFWTSVKLVNKNMGKLKSLNGYNKDWSVEIMAYELTEM